MPYIPAIFFDGNKKEWPHISELPSHLCSIYLTDRSQTTMNIFWLFFDPYLVPPVDIFTK